ncbi:phage tail protein [Candidatus Sororendozoicomonas aggregata]|uniref:phage tail protein n=1 Tax=Candidatus Sororendozoicomonas aggregata TaxID=3073239 RepID=UPI002ECFD3E3
MSDTLMTLGQYRFSINTAAYQTLRRASRYRWQAQQRIGRKPAWQFTGPDADTMTLEGLILPHYQGGLLQIHSLRGEAGRGEPLLMTDGLGNAWGKWCVTELRETQTDLMSNGAPRHIRFQVSLVEYGEDKPDRFTTVGSVQPIRGNVV